MGETCGVAQGVAVSEKTREPATEAWRGWKLFSGDAEAQQMGLANHRGPSTFGPLAVSDTIKCGDGAHNFDTAGAGEPVPKFVVGEWPGVFRKTAKTLSELAADEDAWKRGHGAFQKKAGRIRQGSSMGGFGWGDQFGRGGAGDGSSTDRGKIITKVWDNRSEVPRIERVVFVEYHNPRTAGSVDNLVPITDRAERWSVVVIEKIGRRKTCDDGGCFGQSAVVAYDYFVGDGRGLRGDTSESFRKQGGAVVSRNAEGDEWSSGVHRALASDVRTAANVSVIVIRRTHRFL